MMNINDLINFLEPQTSAMLPESDAQKIDILEISNQHSNKNLALICNSSDEATFYDWAYENNVKVIDRYDTPTSVWLVESNIFPEPDLEGKIWYGHIERCTLEPVFCQNLKPEHFDCIENNTKGWNKGLVHVGQLTRTYFNEWKTEHKPLILKRYKISDLTDVYLLKSPDMIAPLDPGAGIFYGNIYNGGNLNFINFLDEHHFDRGTYCG